MTENTRLEKRIESIDVLRGFALAGILYTHMIIWYTAAALPSEVYSKYDTTLDGIAMAIFGALALGKFFSVFSFLFGLSFYLHFRKNSSHSGHPWLYIWRLCLLFIIGLLHHLFWRGDILAIYAVLGVLLITFRKLPPKFLLGLALLLITNLPLHLVELFQTEVPSAAAELPMAEGAEAYYALVQQGGLGRVLQENWQSWPAKIWYQLESGRLFMTFGYFLLGLYAGRKGLFTALDQHIPRFRSWNTISLRLLLFLLLLGYLMYLNKLVSLPEVEVVPEYKWVASFLYSIYNTAVSVFYITGIALLFRQESYNSLLRPLSALGRMALTTYLLQSLFGLLLFYDFGLGLFDNSPPSVNAFLAVGVFYFQLKFSQWWLTRYRQGPVEWLWRSLSYFRLSSNRKGSDGVGGKGGG